MMAKENSHAPGEGADTSKQDLSASQHEHKRFSQLLEVAHALKHTLEPVEARPSFIEQVKVQIISNVEDARVKIQRRRRRRRHLKWTAIGAGGVVYLVTMGIIMVRITRWGMNQLRKLASQQSN